MDTVTQQNSALVEENAATAKTLEHQAKNMDERVSFFRIDAAAANAAGAAAEEAKKAPAAPAKPAAKRPAAAATRGGPVGRIQGASPSLSRKTKSSRSAADSVSAQYNVMRPRLKMPLGCAAPIAVPIVNS